MTRSLRRLAGGTLLLAVLAGTALGTTGCSAGGGSGDASTSSAVGRADAGAVAAGPVRAQVGAADDTPSGPAIISTGSVELTSDDVPATRGQVLAIVARAGGQVSDEQASSGSPGARRAAATPVGPPITRAHLVVRVPSARFGSAMADLSAVGDFVASSRQARDVTTQVIDVDARVRAEARSVARIQTFFDRATTVKDVIAVESQLSRRQADLDSLRHRAAYLDDQTTLATITVDLSQPTAAARRTHHAAFVGGLAAGWHGLTAVLGFLLRSLGAVLPFLLVMVPVGMIAWLGRRTLVSRRARPSSTDEPAQSS